MGVRRGVKRQRSSVPTLPMVLGAVSAGVLPALDEWFGLDWSGWIFYPLMAGVISVGFAIGYGILWWSSRRRRDFANPS
jgi:hypothetical protein